MAANDEGNNGARKSSSSPVKKKARGTTQLKDLVACHKHQKEPLRIEFDADMNPTGPEQDKFISYIGHLSQTKVGLQYANWKQIDKEQKKMIWE